MKRLVLILIVFLVVLPLSADEIVTGGANSFPTESGWVQITLSPEFFSRPVATHFAMANASINLNEGTYGANAEVFQYFPISYLIHGPGVAGVSKIYWESYPVQGSIPVPLTISPGGGWVDGSWTTMGSVFGYYTWWDGQQIRDEDFIDYDFTGPAEFDFTVWGSPENPQVQVVVNFSAKAPSPIPEPSAFLLFGTGLTVICFHKLRW